MLGPDLMVEWNRRLDDFDRKGWHNVCEIVEGPTCSTSGSSTAPTTPTTASRSASGRASATSCATPHGNTITRNESSSEIVTSAEYWTLGKRDGRWVLLSIEQDAEGAHHLDADIVASPWGDEGRLHDEAVTELATADAVPDAAIAERRRPRLRRHRPRRRARPRDGRRPLRARTCSRPPRAGRSTPGPRRSTAPTPRSSAPPRPGAVRELLYAGRRQRAHPARRPRPAPAGAAHHRAARRRHAARDARRGRRQRPPLPRGPRHRGGRRGLQGRARSRFTERWTMTLDGDEKTPWRIAEAGAPARG